MLVASVRCGYKRALSAGVGPSRVLASSLIAAKVGSCTVRLSSSTKAEDKPVPLCFVAESANFGAPYKVEQGIQTQDALFTSKYGIGIADGVSGWLDQGVDSGHYARAVMERMREQIVDSVINGDAPDPLAALEFAHKNVSLGGSTTVCVVVTQPDGKVLVRNLGDSGVQQWRHERPPTLVPQAPLKLGEASKLWSMLFKTKEQVRGREKEEMICCR
jgi:hypothetical protein